MSNESEKEQTEKAIATFLANGGVIQKIERNVSGRAEGESFSSWSRKKPSTSPLANPPDEE
jgi:hypothetical protein